eukprot:g33534.t1
MLSTSQSRLSATLHLSVVPRSAVSHGKERPKNRQDESKEMDVAQTGFEDFKVEARTSAGGSTQISSDSGSVIVANLGDLTKLGASAILHASSVQESEEGSQYWGPSMDTMSHLGAFADNAAPLSCGFDARIAGIWEGKTSKELGGYDQRIQFHNDAQAKSMDSSVFAFDNFLMLPLHQDQLITAPNKELIKTNSSKTMGTGVDKLAAPCFVAVPPSLNTPSTSSRKPWRPSSSTSHANFAKYGSTAAMIAAMAVLPQTRPGRRRELKLPGKVSQKADAILQAYGERAAPKEAPKKPKEAARPVRMLPLCSWRRALRLPLAQSVQVVPRPESPAKRPRKLCFEPPPKWSGPQRPKLKPRASRDPYLHPGEDRKSVFDVGYRRIKPGEV